MTRSSHIRLVGTTAAPVWLLLLLVEVSKTAAHKPIIRECDRKDMSTVVLAKDKGTGIFTVLQRFAPGEQVPPLNESTGDANTRHLERIDYDAIPPPAAQRFPGGLRSRQPNDQYPGLDLMTDHQFPSSLSWSSLAERFDRRDDRLLETFPSSNDTMMDLLENVDLFYAR